MKYFMIVMLAIGFNTIGWADTFCTGPISMVSMDKNGDVWIKHGSDKPLLICNTINIKNGVQNSICKKWFDIVHAASIAKSKIMIKYNTDNVVCNELTGAQPSIAKVFSVNQ